MQMFRKSASKKRFFRARRGNIVAPVIFLIVAVVALSIFYFASLSKGSRDEYADAQKVKPDPVLAEKTRAEALAAESSFNSVHEFKKDKITAEDIDVFEKAVKLYHDYLAYAGIGENPRYEKMRRQLHDLRGEVLRRNSTQLERDAEDLFTKKNYAEAEKLFSEASKLEFRIAEMYPLATQKNHARANFLENRARTMRAIPMQLEAARLTKEGEAAIDAANWPQAAIRLNDALKIERELWADYRNVILSNDLRIQNLLVLIATVQSAPDYERQSRDIAEANEAERNGNWQLAAEKWADALAMQKAISKNFPKSRYAGEATENELTEKFANASVRPQFIELQKEYAEMHAGIKTRNTGRVPLLAKQILRRAEKILRDAPDSTLISDEFLSELRFMDVKAADIPSVQASFFDLLLPVPGGDGTTKMMKTEVSQTLYTFVMPFNPSAVEDLERPVESVDFSDAKEFCRRLSLLVGRAVRLPTDEEFSAAAGTPTADELLAQAWLIENSAGNVHAGATRHANAAGFFDLYGNVSEWIAEKTIDGKTVYRVAGGDCQTPSYAFPKNLFRETLPTDKSRTRGFRVVAEIPAENAPAGK